MSREGVRVITVFLAIAMVMSLQTVIGQNNSLSNPAAVGVRVQSKLELGLIYDIGITVLETARGAEAMKLLKAADAENPEPSEGFEYILARVKFEIAGRSDSNRSRSFVLRDNPMQWAAMSSDLIEYPQVDVKVPEPELKGRVNPGQSVEGWAVYAISKEDDKPMMVFDPANGGSMGRGHPSFFKLY